MTTSRRERERMEIIIKAEPKEIAALVVAIQGRQGRKNVELKIGEKSIGHCLSEFGVDFGK